MSASLSLRSCLWVVSFLLIANTLFGARIGLFFGNFDPVHSAHLTIIEKSVSVLNLERMYAIPYLVSDSDFPVSFSSRCEMLQKALQSKGENLKVPCEKLELWNEERPLSSDPDSLTERILKEIFYLEGWDHNYYQIMGSDDFQRMLKFQGFPSDEKPLSIVVIKRPGFNQTIPRHLIPALGERLFPIDLDTPRVSSKEIRGLLKQGVISPYLSDEVVQYIRARKLYGLEDALLQQPIRKE